jgi:hypothetical protein
MQAKGLTSTQKGKIVESLVSSSLMLISNGRLSSFAPLSDDCGIDLIVVDKETGRKLSVQVKSRIENPKRRTIQFKIRKPSFRADPDRYLLGVLFNPTNLALTTSWFLPMVSVLDLAVQKPSAYAVTPAVANSSKDRYRHHRYDSASALVAAILETIDRNGRSNWSTAVQPISSY